MDVVWRASLVASAALLAACAAHATATAPASPPAGQAGGSVPATRLVMETRAPFRDLDCADLPDQPAAQDVLRRDTSDPHHLDADRDGVACEDLRR